MSDDRGEAIAITGLGMCTALGAATTSCAAIRAGLSAARPIEGFVVRDADDVEEPGTGHPVRTISGFQGAARLLCLAWSAFEDLATSTKLDSIGFAKTGLLLAVPGPPPKDGTGPGRPNFADSWLIPRLLQRMSIDLPETHRWAVFEGRRGVLHAIGQASVRLRSGEWHRAIVGGVDSLLDSDVLEGLGSSGRVKTPVKPDGLLPGEAAAFLMLERTDVARKRGAEVLATLGAVGFAQESIAGRPPSGVALSQAIVSVGAGPFWLVSDHNGENGRAWELGATLARLGKQSSFVSSARWVPAESLGDMGVAAGGVGACVATRAFARGYAVASSAIVVASEDGACGALRLMSPQGA